MVAVKIQGLRKRFGNTEVLKGIDIEVPDGGFAVLVGPSGCGKSTLLRLLAGLETSDEGSIHFGDKNVTRLEPRERDIAMVFQSYALYPHLTVRENLSFGLQLRKTDKAEIEKRVDEVAEMLGLAPLLGRMPRALSGGQRQRVAMGRAIVRRPALFLFDEPLSNLDAALRAQVRVEIRKLHDRLGATSAYVTHDQVEAMTLADSLFVLNKGLVEQAGRPLEVYSRPATRFVAEFLGSPGMNFLDAELVSAAGGLGVQVGERRLDVAAEHLGDKAEAGKKVTLGVRPHEVLVVEGEGPAELEAQVDVVEALGSESFAHARLASGTGLVARIDGSRVVKAGDSLRLHIPSQALHVFDAETGRALWND